MLSLIGEREINMEIKGTTIAGAGIGAATGAAAGFAVGSKKAGEFLKSKGITKGMTSDQFVQKGIKGFMKSKQYSGLNVNKKVNIKTRINKDFTAKYAEFMQTAKNTKIKWVAGLAAAGLAVGVIASKVAQKISAGKEA